MRPIIPGKGGANDLRLGPAFWNDAYALLACINDEAERRSAFYDLLCTCADQMDEGSRRDASRVACALCISPANALPLVVPVDYFLSEGLRPAADMSVWEDTPEAEIDRHAPLRSHRADQLSRFFAVAAALMLLGFVGRLAVWEIFHK